MTYKNISTRKKAMVWDWRSAVYAPESGLDTMTTFLLVTIHTFLDPDGRGAFPSVSRLARMMKCTERTVYNCLNRAEEAGFIKRGKHGFRGQRADQNEYEACLPDVFEAGNPTPERDETDSPLNPSGMKHVQPTDETRSALPLNEIQPYRPSIKPSIDLLCDDSKKEAVTPPSKPHQHTSERKDRGIWTDEKCISHAKAMLALPDDVQDLFNNEIQKSLDAFKANRNRQPESLKEWNSWIEKEHSLANPQRKIQAHRQQQEETAQKRKAIQEGAKVNEQRLTIEEAKSESWKRISKILGFGYAGLFRSELDRYSKPYEATTEWEQGFAEFIQKKHGSRLS